MVSSLRIFALSFAAGTAVSVASLACDNPNPGVPVGSYAVTSALSENSCGSGVAPSDPGNFDVTISNSDGVYYWFPDTGGSSVEGKINSARTVSSSEVVADNVDGTEAGAGPCTMQRSDTLTYTMGTGAVPASLTGSYSSVFSTASGATCTDQLATHGGAYAALPCTVTYSLSGALQ
jgi:hypothetical protein